MMHANRLVIAALLLMTTVFYADAQKIKKNDKVTIAHLQEHINYLADDKLEGRRTGSAGEKLTMEYISSRFGEIGLLPKGENNFIQPFDVYDGKQMSDKSKLSIEGTDLVAADFFIFPYSPSIKIEALPSIALSEADMPWFFDIKELMEANSGNPHFDPEEAIHAKAIEVAGKGATALFVYNGSNVKDNLQFNTKDKTEKTKIPVVYIAKNIADKYLKDESATLDIKLMSEIIEKKRTGHNVIGYIDNGATNTVVLGAHYDHLGYGEDGNSLLRTGEKLIHNGADDNASGTAALIELARMLKADKQKNSNYLFIAFSGEELGLFGSKYFTEHPTVDLSKVNYMINMDMVGRLNDSSKAITIGGFGTSPAWAFITKEKKPVFNIKVDSSGSGPSDHTSFYRKNIPVLFFFTGLHSDYHKPSDDASKINVTGEMLVVNYIYDLVNTVNKKDQRIVFQKTRDIQPTSPSRFSVTLGIMPDYTFNGAGVKADGVTEGRPAQKAGIQAGDIIVQLGAYNISSMENYMQALGNFKKGDQVKLKYKRGNEIKETNVEF